MIVDRGSNAGWGVEGITSLLVAGPYNWEAHDLRGYGVQTNRFTFGAYRAPGAPTAAFALESLLDDLANALGARSDRASPEERRRRGRRRDQRQSVPGHRCAGGARAASSEHPLWASRDSLPGERRDRHGGRPLARGARACGGCLPRGRRRDDDGRDVGSGHERRELGLRGHRGRRFRPLAGEGARRLAPTRALGPYAGGSGGSKVTYTVGAAVLRAAESAREKVLAAASQELEIAPDDLEVDGRRRARGRRSRPLDHGRGARKEGPAFRRALRADRRPRRLGADERRALRRGPPLARSRRSRDGRGRAAPTT